VNPRSLRFRITAWYFATVAFLLAVFGVGAGFAMRAGILRAVDRNLRTRISDVRGFLSDQTTAGRDEVREELSEQSLLGLGGPLLEVRDQAGNLIFRSPRLHGDSIQFADSETLRIAALRRGVLHLRVASQRLTVNGHTYTVSVADPMHQFYESMQQFRTALLISAPLALILASLGGYWMSHRALAPVDRISSDARSISLGNLDRRLPVPPARDEIHRLATTLNDMLDRIDTAVKRIVQFTADASHELRAPLALIQTAAEFSLRRERSHDDLLGAMRKIQRETVRTSRLVDDLLLLARADSGADTLQLARTGLAGLASQAAEQAALLAEPKQIEVHVQIAAAPIVVQGDEQALARLLLILLDNAIKYTNDGGRVDFELHVADSHAEIVVSDTGVGIAPADLAHIYDRFWRSDKVRSRGANGAGLGLSIAQWIVEKHGGEIRITSSPGHGSKAIVRLPLWTERSAADHGSRAGGTSMFAAGDA